MKKLIVQNKEHCNQQAMIELKMKSQEEKINELFEIHSYLMYINSSENSKNSDDKPTSSVSILQFFFLAKLILCTLYIFFVFLGKSEKYSEENK